MPIRWEFDGDVPTRDVFESLDLSDPAAIDDAVECFIDEMETDRFRCWEAIIRREQDLPRTRYMELFIKESIDFENDDRRILYIGDVPRHAEPWYESLRKLAPRLLLEPFRTSDMHYAWATEGWPALEATITNHSRGLSLPDGLREPLDVLPVALRHKLRLQSTFDELSGLGQFGEITLADEGQVDRVDSFLAKSSGCRESVQFLKLTLQSLLERVVLPETDRRIFVQMVCERLGLEGLDTPLAPHLQPPAAIPSERVESLPDDVIKQAITHSSPIVRLMAADCYGHGRSLDPTIMPLIIRAVEQFGWKEAFQNYGFLEHLAQTEQSVTWMVERWSSLLDTEEADSSNYLDLVQTLSVVDPHLLEPHAAEIRRPDQDGLGCGTTILARYDCLRLDKDKLWDRLRELISYGGDEYPEFPETETLNDFASLLGRDERLVSWVFDTLARGADDPEYSAWREGYAMEMAGNLRLTEALPYLVAALYDDEIELNNIAITALQQIGTVQVVETLASRFSTVNENFQWCAVSLLNDMRTAESYATLFAWMKEERQERLRWYIMLALLGDFVPDAIEPARQVLLAENVTSLLLRDLRIKLIGASTVAGRDFPEFEAWKDAAEKDRMLSREQWENQFGDDEVRDEDDEDGGIVDEDPLPLVGLQEPVRDGETIVNTKSKVGRNDACPCGSGKKYKKCCMRKQR